MPSFEEEIKRMAEEREERRLREREEEKSTEETQIEIPEEIKEAFYKLFNLANTGIEAYNEGAGRDVLSIYKLPRELFTFFLDLPGKQIGFCIIAPERFVVFTDERPDKVTVFGQRAKRLENAGQAQPKIRQLIKMTCLKSENGLIFKDNTDAVLDPEEVTKIIIKWVTE